MRRTLAALSATAVLIPLAVTAAPGAASAATNTLTVTAIGRDGAKVKTSVSVVNLQTNMSYTLTSGKARTLPKGSYAAMTRIDFAKDGTSTLGGRTVKVSGATRTTIDARNGRRLAVTASPAPANGGGQQITAQVCAANGRYYNSVRATTAPGKLYVIPNGSTNLRLAYLAHWYELNKTRTGTESYLVAGGMKEGITGLNRVVKRSSLATVDLKVRKGLQLSSYTQLRVEANGRGCYDGLGTGVDTVEAPFQHKTHISSGKWMLQAHDRAGLQWKAVSLGKGATYSKTFFRAGWSPDGRLPLVRDRMVQYRTDSMFVDPGFPERPFAANPSTHSFYCCTKSVVTLIKGGKVLKKQTRTEWGEDRTHFQHRISSAGWYGLTVDARRHHPEIAAPAGLLSNRTVARFRFHADPARTGTAAVHLPRFLPLGLDGHNRAKAGSATSVELTLHRPGQGVKMSNSKVKTVQFWASYDNGKTWKKAALKKSGGKWVATVKNPGSGYVALRSKVTDTLGNYSDITIYRAYRIV